MPNKKKSKKSSKRVRRRWRDNGANPAATNLNPWRRSVVNWSLTSSNTYIFTPNVLFQQFCLQELDIATIDPKKWYIRILGFCLYGAIPNDNNTGLIAMQPFTFVDVAGSGSTITRRGTQTNRAFLKYFWPRADQNVAFRGDDQSVDLCKLLGTKGAYVRFFVATRMNKDIPNTNREWGDWVKTAALGLQHLSIVDDPSDEPDLYEEAVDAELN